MRNLKAEQDRLRKTGFSTEEREEKVKEETEVDTAGWCARCDERHDDLPVVLDLGVGEPFRLCSVTCLFAFVNGLEALRGVDEEGALAILAG